MTRSTHVSKALPFASLAELIRSRSEDQPDLDVYTYLDDGESESSTLNYRQLDCRARQVAAWLDSVSRRGDRVLLLLAPGLDFIAAFFGCAAGGRIAVPVAPPLNARDQRGRERLNGILKSAGAAAAIVARAYLPMLDEQSGRLAVLNMDDAIALHAAHGWPQAEPSADTPAMLQYTSGTTSAPRGVVVTHGNLLHNSEHIRRRFEHTPASRGMIWLPPYHDMGLIGGIIQPLYAGFAVTLMSPMHFIQRPLRWLQAISRFACTTSGGPNFAYDLCVERITDEERASLDLSRWDVAFTGAEPVREETLRRFAEAFAPAGFDPRAFYPCYGLAEATLMVSGGSKMAGRVCSTVLSAPLERHRVADADGEAHPTTTLVGCGRPLDDQHVLAVDPVKATPCSEDEIGEIWVRGASVAAGYWNEAEESRAAIDAYLATDGSGPFLRTGDLGCFRQGELFITGRLKDLIIVAGRNHYPQDIEKTVESSHPELRTGGCAAFGVDVDGEEQLVIVAEVDRRVERAAAALRARSDSVPHGATCAAPRGALDEIVAAVRRAIAERHQLRAADVCLIRTASLAKTLSGKTQRHVCRRRYLAGTVERVR